MSNKSSKKILLGSATLIAAGVLPAAVSMVPEKADAASANVAINAVVVAPVVITSSKAIDFGSLSHTLTGGNTGTAAITNLSAVTSSAKVNTFGTAQAGVIKVTAGANVQITTPATAALVGVPSGAMTASNFTVNGNALPYSVNPGGLATYGVGATLKLTEGVVKAGTYTGTVAVTAAYN